MSKYRKALFDLAQLISPNPASRDFSSQIAHSPDTPWQEIIDFANQHLLVPTLYSALDYKGLLGGEIKDELIVDYLSTVYRYNHTRNEAIMVQLRNISSLFAQIGTIPPVLLKGAAALSEGYYPHIGARSMLDIDMLVNEKEILQCIALLETKGGYRPVDETAPEWLSHQYRRIYTDNGVGALELHRHALIKRCQSYFSDEELMRHVKPSKLIENAYVMEPTYDLYHVFLHSEMQDSGHANHFLSLRPLHHAATIITKCQNEIQWDILDKKCQEHGLKEVWQDYLYKLDRLFGVEIPTEMIGTSNHFENSLESIDKYSKSHFVLQLYLETIMEYFSYKETKERYGFVNPATYPFAILFSLVRLVAKNIFLPQSRKELGKLFKKTRNSKKFSR